MLKNIFLQFSKPEGFLGTIVGNIMTKSNQELNAWTISMLNLSGNDNVLEIGFGPGIAIKMASSKINGLIAGIDYSEVMLRQAKKRNMKGIKQGKIDLRLATVEDLPSFNVSFDKVFAVNSFIFWKEPVESLIKIKRSMSNLGLIALTVQQRYRGVTNSTPNELADNIEESLKAAGFTEIQTEIKSMKPVSGICVLATKPHDQ